MGLLDTTVTEIRDMAISAGITTAEAWEQFIYPALSASLSTAPGVVPNTSQSL
jgi:hypothetical protein